MPKKEPKQIIEKKVSGHGSLTKSGKVRSQTLKVPRTAKNKKTIPRIRLGRKFIQFLDKPKSNREDRREI